MIVDDGWAGRLMGWLRALSALIVVNLLFLAGVAVGLVVFGVMPAALAATACLTRLRDGAADGLVRLFIAEYRAGFRRANLLGVPFALVFALILIDTALLPELPAAASAALAVCTWVIGAYATATLAATLAIDVRYDDGVRATLRFAIALPLTSPLMTVVMLVSLLTIAAVFAALPMLLPLFCGAVPLFVAGWFVDHRLAQLDPNHPRAAAVAAR